MTTQFIPRFTSRTLFSLVLIAAFILTSFASAGERGMRKGRPERRGNENSQRVTEIQVGEAVYGGNGCPQGTMRAVFAPDNLSFSLLFDQFIAEVTDPAQAKRDVMACDVIIPIQIPQNMQMKITRVDLRGFSALPDRARAQLHSVFNFRGPRGDGDRLNLRFNFAGPAMENYEISSDTLSPGDTEMSPCGGNVRLRIMNQLKVQTPRRGEAASVTLDSIDGASEAIYFVGWQACTGR